MKERREKKTKQAEKKVTKDGYQYFTVYKRPEEGSSWNVGKQVASVLGVGPFATKERIDVVDAGDVREFGMQKVDEEIYERRIDFEKSDTRHMGHVMKPKLAYKNNIFKSDAEGSVVPALGMVSGSDKSAVLDY